jgi:hypothetical protein
MNSRERVKAARPCSSASRGLPGRGIVDWEIEVNEHLVDHRLHRVKTGAKALG